MKEKQTFKEIHRLLLKAIEDNQEELVKDYLQKGFPVNQEFLKKNEEKDCSLLKQACLNHRVNLVKALIEAGADVHEVSDQGYGMVLISCLNFSDLKPGQLRSLLEVLSQAGLSMNEKNNMNETPLIFACENPKVELSVIEFLLKKGASIHDKEAWGDTPLSLVCQNNREDVLELLLETGEVDSSVKSFIMEVSVIHKADRCVQLLMDRGYDVKTNSLFLLNRVLANDDPIIFKMLLEEGLSVQEKEMEKVMGQFELIHCRELWYQWKAEKEQHNLSQVIHPVHAVQAKRI